MSLGNTPALGEVVSWLGCLSGLIGSYLLSNNDRRSGWGFVAYLVSNAGWMIFAVVTHNVPMAVQQLGFSYTSIRGIKRWIIDPMRSRSKARFNTRRYGHARDCLMRDLPAIKARSIS